MCNFLKFGRRSQPKIEPMQQPQVAQRSGPWGRLVALVGLPVALALATFIPHEESGREVEAVVAADGSLDLRHIRGRQYLTVYRDVVGVNTACDGITTLNGKPMPANHTFTEAECAELLVVELVKHTAPVIRCSPGLAVSDDPAAERVREGPRFLAVSLAYNVGVGAYCGSTAARRFNAGDYDGGCEAATWWNKAGGRVFRGLVNRRNREKLVCTEGLDALAQAMGRG